MSATFEPVILFVGGPEDGRVLIGEEARGLALGLVDEESRTILVASRRATSSARSIRGDPADMIAFLEGSDPGRGTHPPAKYVLDRVRGDVYRVCFMPTQTPFEREIAY